MAKENNSRHTLTSRPRDRQTKEDETVDSRCSCVGSDQAHLWEISVSPNPDLGQQREQWLSLRDLGCVADLRKSSKHSETRVMWNAPLLERQCSNDPKRLPRLVTLYVVVPFCQLHLKYSDAVESRCFNTALPIESRVNKNSGCQILGVDSFLHWRVSLLSQLRWHSARSDQTRSRGQEEGSSFEEVGERLAVYSVTHPNNMPTIICQREMENWRDDRYDAWTLDGADVELDPRDDPR
jgi:hypothetical protein